MSEEDQNYKSISHPMEEVLNIEPNTTLIPYNNQETELVKYEEYDQKDCEIEQQFQQVYDAAMNAFDESSVGSGTMDPKYKARNEEVAVQYLNTALSAAKEKASLKNSKDKLNLDSKKASTPNSQNVVFADRNDILKTIFGNKEEKSVDNIDEED